MNAPEASFVISGADLQGLTSPIVYVWARGEETLYVGRSAHGLSRLLDRRHHVIGYRRVMASDAFSVWRCLSLDEAVDLEEQLIAQLRPTFNVVGNYDGEYVEPVSFSRPRAIPRYRSPLWARLRGRPLKAAQDSTA